jgi:hypothetical protein
MMRVIIALAAPGERDRASTFPRAGDPEGLRGDLCGLGADMNRDHKPDIVAINPTQAVWFENPGSNIVAVGCKTENVKI